MGPPRQDEQDTGTSRPRISGRSEAAPAPVHLAALTSTRFFAALLVMVFHVTEEMPLLNNVPGWVRSIITSGYVWVGYFFILSGFILMYQYQSRYESGRFNAREFWLARFARIYPGHGLGFFLVLLVGWIFPSITLGPPNATLAVKVADVGLTSILMQAWVPSFADTFNFPSWSLSAEWFFYLMFPLLLPVTTRLSVRRLLLLAAAGLALETVGLAVYSATSGHDGSSGAIPVTFIKFSPLVRFMEFIFGVVVARVYRERVALGLTERWGSRLVGVALCFIALGLAGVCDVPFVIRHNVALAIPFGALILGLALAPASGISRWLSMSLLVRLGECSYSFYILHGAFIYLFFGSGWGNRTGILEAVGGRIALVVGVTVAALLSHHLIENRARRWIRSFGQ